MVLQQQVFEGNTLKLKNMILGLHLLELCDSIHVLSKKDQIKHMSSLALFYQMGYI